MKVVVTGGAGFIGSHFVDALLSAGHQPFVIDNLVTGSRQNLPLSVPFYQIDLRHPQQLATVFDEIRPDWVCHQAAQLSVSRSMREPAYDAGINIIGLLNVLEQSARVGVRRIAFASSGGVLYGDVDAPAVESAPKNPISPYGISKWAGERYLEFFAREHHLDAVALRYSNVYGPRQNPLGEAGVVAIFCTKMLTGAAPTIYGDGSAIRDYVFGPDVALANLAAFESKLPDRFVAVNIGVGMPKNVNDVASQVKSAVADYLRQKGKPFDVPDAIHGQARAGDLRSNLVSPGLAEQLLGWRPRTTFEVGIRETVRYFANALGI